MFPKYTVYSVNVIVHWPNGLWFLQGKSLTNVFLFYVIIITLTFTSLLTQTADNQYTKSGREV